MTELCAIMWSLHCDSKKRTTSLLQCCSCVEAGACEGGGPPAGIEDTIEAPCEDVSTKEGE